MTISVKLFLILINKGNAKIDAYSSTDIDQLGSFQFQDDAKPKPCIKSILYRAVRPGFSKGKLSKNLL